jgi:hypothetical protein
MSLAPDVRFKQRHKRFPPSIKNLSRKMFAQNTEAVAQNVAGKRLDLGFVIACRIHNLPLRFNSAPPGCRYFPFKQVKSESSGELRVESEE